LQSLVKNGYTEAQVITALHSANRQMAFRYELLDSTNVFKRQLDNVLNASVNNNTENEIKRTARFSIRDDGTINFLSDRIKPWVRLKMPDGGWAEWPQGVFLLSTPPRKVDAAGVVTREVEAYDQLQVLVDDKIEYRYTVTTGTNYIIAIKAVLDGAGITQQNLTATALTLSTDWDWSPGTEKLKIINDLLSAINYRSLWFDENGQAIAQPYVTPANRASEYTYRDDNQSVIFPDVAQELDLFGVPNKWVLYVSEADQATISSIYTNTNPNSLTSTVSRGRTITTYQQVDAADQTTLDDLVEKKAYEDSQIYEQVTLETAIMPMHSEADVFTLAFSGLGISAKYSEISWSMELKAGAKMRHLIRRTVTI